MRKTVLVWSVMMLGGCEMYDSPESEDDEAVDSASQDDSGDETVIDSWSALESLKEQNPELYQTSVDVLVEAGVPCSEEDAATGFCLNLDEGGTEGMLMKGPVRCYQDCPPSWAPDHELCSTICCITVIWEICGPG